MRNKTVISLYPGVRRQTNKMFSIGDKKVVVDCSSFNSVSNLFYARGVMAEKVLIRQPVRSM